MNAPHDLFVGCALKGSRASIVRIHVDVLWHLRPDEGSVEIPRLKCNLAGVPRVERTFMR